MNGDFRHSPDSDDLSDDASEDPTLTNIPRLQRSSRPTLKIPSIVSLAPPPPRDPFETAEFELTELANDEVDDAEEIETIEASEDDDGEGRGLAGPEAGLDWRDEVPTLVLERALGQGQVYGAQAHEAPSYEAPSYEARGHAPVPDADLSVVFRAAQSRAPTIPPGMVNLGSASVPPPLPPPPSLTQAFPSLSQPPPSFFQPPPPPPVASVSSVPPPPPASFRSLLPPPLQPAIPPPPRTPSNLALPESSFSLKDTDSVRPIAVDAWARRASVLRRGPFAPWQLAVAALCGGAALFGSFVWWDGRYGELVVDIADQQCGSLESVRVYVDDELRCTSAPCTLRVRTGGHLVRAEVDGYAPAAARAVFVDADVPALHKIQAGVSDKTAIEVRGGAQDGQLYIDGSLEGLLPKRVTGLTRGEHKIVIRDAKGAVALERTVFLEEEQLLVLDLSVPPAPSAPPVSDEATQSTDRPQARSGGPSYQSVEPRSNDTTFAQAATNSAEAESGSSNGSEPQVTTKRKEAETGRGALRLTAEPSAMVLVDGRPLGQTPQRIAVDAGVHTILFVHPEFGRSRVTAKVNPGQTRNLHAKF